MLAEYEEFVSGRDTSHCPVFDDGAVGEVVLHGAVPYGEGFLPYCVSSDPVPAVGLVEPYDVAWEVEQ